jgi:Ca2+-transporting ATPase
MADKPRNREAFILGRPMLSEIFGVGGFFFVMLFFFLLVFKHADVQSLTDNYEYISYTYFARRYYYSIGETSGK